MRLLRWAWRFVVWPVRLLGPVVVLGVLGLAFLRWGVSVAAPARPWTVDLAPVVGEDVFPLRLVLERDAEERIWLVLEIGGVEAFDAAGHLFRSTAPEDGRPVLRVGPEEGSPWLRWAIPLGEVFREALSPGKPGGGNG
ncbi:hypothetical protein [Thermaerobacter litoralis]